MEVRLRIPAAIPGRRRARTARRPVSRLVLRLDALHRSPRLYQRAVDGEVLVDPGLDQDRAQELRGDVAFKQPVPVLREHRMVPRRIVDADADEPPEQQVVFQALHQQPFRADRIESLPQHGPKQFLRRNRGPPDRRIEPRKIPFQRSKRVVHDQPDSPQSMIPTHPILEIDIAEKLTRPHVAAAHPSSPNPTKSVNHASADEARGFFNSLLGIAKRILVIRDSIEVDDHSHE